MAALDELQKRFGTNNITVVAVNPYEKARDFSQWLDRARRNGLLIDVSLVFDSTGVVRKSYGVTRIPVTVVIDREGVVRWYQQGWSEEIREEMFRQAAQALPGIP